MPPNARKTLTPPRARRHHSAHERAHAPKIVFSLFHGPAVRVRRMRTPTGPSPAVENGARAALPAQIRRGPKGRAHRRPLPPAKRLGRRCANAGGPRLPPPFLRPAGSGCGCPAWPGPKTGAARFHPAGGHRPQFAVGGKRGMILARHECRRAGPYRSSPLSAAPAQVPDWVLGDLSVCWSCAASEGGSCCSGPGGWRFRVKRGLPSASGVVTSTVLPGLAGLCRNGPERGWIRVAAGPLCGADQPGGFGAAIRGTAEQPPLGRCRWPASARASDQVARCPRGVPSPVAESSPVTISSSSSLNTVPWKAAGSSPAAPCPMVSGSLSRRPGGPSCLANPPRAK